MPRQFSFIIPVYNRPEEIDELLASMCELEGTTPFQVVIVEDGSTRTSETVVERYRDKLDLLYLSKPNTGPGDSRNYGMSKAAGDLFLILDSDCILPPTYLNAVNEFVSAYPKSCFGGPDRSHASFSRLQKAIDHVMTSTLTTGGIRGSRLSTTTYEPRSFNMGLTREAFDRTGGFGTIHPGEDPDLSIRMRKSGIETRFLPQAYVYHKRRISWSKFYQQVRKFGLVRPILSSWHPETASLTYWFPTFFIVFVLASLVMSLVIGPWTLVPLGIYLFAVAMQATLRYRDILIGLMAIPALFVQFFGYGMGFLESTVVIRLLGRSARSRYPQLFFD